ncbi:hypothetical protein CP533_2596 [Ophiocordyceps camponoti-saundersi (nom. inval.)]|nr:hypothetical protein CP533_2596 [Ophiocordyceps camponoti-saundersi (nom. inval.)]
MAKAFLAHALLLGSCYVTASVVPSRRSVTNCALWQEYSSRTSDELLNEISSASEDFKRLNPDVELSGEAVIAGPYYCLVGAGPVPSGSRERPSHGLISRDASPRRRIPNLWDLKTKTVPEMELCQLKHYIKPGDTCESIQKLYNLSFEDLHNWNPSIGKCCESLHAGDCICVTKPTGVLHYGLSGISFP